MGINIMQKYADLFSGNATLSLNAIPTRQCIVDVVYAGKSITRTLENYQTSFTYTDNASGESDNIALDICDPDARWCGAWAPKKGDRIAPHLVVKDWNNAGTINSLDCGEFILDSVDFSGEPRVLSMGAVSVPADDAFHVTKLSKTWEKTTLKQIAEGIAAQNKMALTYDAEDYPIDKREQSKETDSQFINKLVEDYGLCVKVYAKKLIIFDRAKYKEKEATSYIGLDDIKPNWSFKSDLAGNYTGVEISYTDGKKSKEVKYTFGQGPRWLKLNQKVDSQADAERIAKGKLEKENHEISTLSINVMGNPQLVATMVVNIVGLGTTISGKYYINKVTHSMGGSAGYETALEMSLVSNLTEAVVLYAIQCLANIEVVNTPSYWVAHYKDVLHLDELLVDMATRLKVIPNGAPLMSENSAINTMAEEGVINNAPYWIQHKNDLPYLGQLFKNAAQSVLTEEGSILTSE